MKLIRHGLPGQEKTGIIDAQGKRRDTSTFGEDYGEAFFASDGPARLAKWLEQNDCPEIGADQRLGPPIARPSKIICVGLNYAPHAEESKMELPKEPIVFFKATSAICGPYDEVIMPPESQSLDWEIEMAVVIGKKASHVSLEDAMHHVAGYTILNDVSERDFQLRREGQWVKGKSADTFAPMGPYLLTSDKVPDPHSLDISLAVNGEILQNSNTRHMIFKVPFLVHYLSQFMSLLPGDVISTGTPSGVGLGFDPPRYLKRGDVMELSIGGLGSSKQTVR